LLKQGYQWQLFCGVVQASEVSSPNYHKAAIKPFIGFKLSSNEIAGEWQDYCFHTRALGVIDKMMSGYALIVKITQLPGRN